MHLLLLFSFTLFGTILTQESTSTFDNVDVDSVLKNDRLLKNYVNCLLDRGRCTSQGIELKKYIKENLDTNCAKCSAKQRQGIRKVFKYLTENRREWWNELLLKYDPKGVHKQEYEELYRKDNINL